MFLETVIKVCDVAASFVLLYTCVQVSVNAAEAISRKNGKKMAADFAILALLYFLLGLLVSFYREV